MRLCYIEGLKLGMGNWMVLFLGFEPVNRDVMFFVRCFDSAHGNLMLFV